MNHIKLKPSQKGLCKSSTPQWFPLGHFVSITHSGKENLCLFQSSKSNYTHKMLSTQSWGVRPVLKTPIGNVHSSPCGRYTERMNYFTTSLWTLVPHVLALQVMHKKNTYVNLHTHNLIPPEVEIQHTWCYTVRITYRQNFKHNSFQLSGEKASQYLWRQVHSPPVYYIYIFRPGVSLVTQNYHQLALEHTC